jgi:hypothetical protein
MKKHYNLRTPTEEQMQKMRKEVSCLLLFHFNGDDNLKFKGISLFWLVHIYSIKAGAKAFDQGRQRE